ncbi:hypothetical protein HCH73_19035 [Citrobacter koseri]|uniref:hypothetical protein n=1 Tax=Citrobacter koseri TaxID=545 RepID=UPI0018E0E5BF|nr:hypothetical protein [Citrobacter koseri]MBI0679124.1 hypothetical protein [Citrobacter koseri]
MRKPVSPVQATRRTSRPSCSLWRSRPVRSLRARHLVLCTFAALVVVMLLRMLIRFGG